MARLDFVSMVGMIYSYAISTEVSKGGALQLGYVTKMQTHHEEDRKEFNKRLYVHVQRRLYYRSSAAEAAEKRKEEKAEKRLKLEEELAKRAAKGGSRSLFGSLRKAKNKVAAAAEDMIDAAADSASAAIEAMESDTTAPAEGVVTEGDNLGAKKTGGADDLGTRQACTCGGSALAPALACACRCA